MKKILVVGGTSRHMQRWFRNVVPEVKEHMQVDMFCVSEVDVPYEGASHIYHSYKPSWPLKLLYYIPKLNAHLYNRRKVNMLKKLLTSEKYDLINIHQPAIWLIPFVRFAKSKGCKTVISPWGSEVLRCPTQKQNAMSEMLRMADFITCGIQSFMEKIKGMYHISPAKFVSVGFGSEIFDLIPSMKGKRTKRELAKELNIPQADYFIACGYTAQKAQRHISMIEALGQNKDVLPHNTLLLFQFTYGNNHDVAYKQEIEHSCDKYGLRYFFLTNYLSNEDMAKYRLLCDLFIHLQPTDAGNASLQEFLLAGAQCINGMWLKYPLLEQDGVPYHICDSLENLPNLIRSFFNNEMPKKFISEQVSKYILNASWSCQSKRWADLLYLL